MLLPEKKVPQRMTKRAWKHLQQLRKNLIIIIISEVGWIQGLLALEFCLLNLNKLSLKPIFKNVYHSLAKFQDIPWSVRSQKITKKCRRYILLCNIKYGNTTDFIAEYSDVAKTGDTNQDWNMLLINIMKYFIHPNFLPLGVPFIFTLTASGMN